MRDSIVLRAVFFALCFVLLLGHPAGAERDASGDAWWTHADWPVVQPEGALALTEAGRAHGLWTLDRARLEETLATAYGPDGAELTLPMPDGSLQRFLVVEESVLDPSLAVRHPSIRTYAGRGLDFAESLARITVTPAGLHAFVSTEGRNAYVDPLAPGDARTHVAYSPAHLDCAGKHLTCGTHADRMAVLAGAGFGGGLSGLAVTAGATLRTYRLAVSTTPEYTAWALGHSGSVLGEVAQTVNEINLIYQRDAGIRFQLAANTDQLFYTAATNPYTDTADTSLLEVHNAITAVLGSTGFDVGHLFQKFGLGGFGGVAQLSSACKDLEKGMGRSGEFEPTGPLFNSVVVHELGHQFSAGHTWVADNENPAQFSPTTAWEPGRGVTIMSYGGRVFDNDAIPGAVYDLSFHGGSIEEIVTYTTTGAGNCPTPVASGNAPPTANAGLDHTIPHETPFRLVASATDPDDALTNLTYVWEELDACPYQADLAQLDDGVVPLFTSLPPSSARVRSFPLLGVLQAGMLFPATTTPGMLGQQLPRTARTMTFRLTVRDNRPGGAVVTGGVDQDDVLITVDNLSGPFRVTSPNGGEFWPAGTAQTVTWDVAGTNGPPVATTAVDILLSLDQGFSWSVLLAGTPNDGAQAVTLPSCVGSTTCRVEVRAAGNIFFDMSDADFEIGDDVKPIVACAAQRSLLWPARFGLMPVGLTFAVTDDCDPSPTRTISVYSTESAGAPPYAPDALFAAPSDLRLRAERAFPGPGRVYLVVISATDAGGNRGVACCDVIVPVMPTTLSILTLKATGAAARAACLASPTDVAPPGFVALLQAVSLP